MGSTGRKFSLNKKAPGRKIKYSTAAEKAILKFRNSKRWLKCRLYKLAVDPLCEYPKCDRGGTDCHHIHTLAEEYPYFQNATNLDNLRTLCQKCHGKVTSMENKGRREEAKQIFNKEQGE